MAAGDIVVFDQFIVDMANGVHTLSSDTIKIAFVSNAVTPATTTADPRWGAGGSTNLSTDEQSGGNFTAGGTALASVTSALATGAYKFDAADPATFSQNASNPTSIYHAIIYNDTATGKNAICAIDMGGPVSGVTGDVTVTFNASGIITGDQA